MMKNKLMWFAVMILTVSTAFAQKATFKVQGIERPDLEQRFSQKKPVVKAEAKADEATFSFADINFWVGEGTNQAALVIDWHDESLDHALVWGFRWNGEATGYDMVAAIAAADPRFTLLTHETNLGNTVAGLGLKKNLPSEMELTFTPDEGEPEYFTPENGIVITEAYNYDNWTASDGALWKSGWYDNGYWSYQVKDNVSEEFSFSGVGASSRELTDGCVDGWSFASLDGTTEGSLPRSPYGAVVDTRFRQEPTDANAYWGQMYMNPEHQAITSKALATQAEKLSVKWEYNFGGYSGQPIIAGDYMYNTSGKKIYKVSIADGSLVASNEMVGTIGFFSMLAYGDGKIFVTLGNGVTQAFDAVTLESLWQAQVPEKGQQLCPIVYHDGHIYTGTWNGGKPATGVFYCLSTADEKPDSTLEVKTPVWKSDNTGFYWSGGTIVDECIYVGGDDGIMRAYKLSDGTVIDAWEIAPDLETSTIRSGTSYDAKTKRLFFTGKEAKKIYSVRINDDGTFDNASKLSTDIAGQATTTPTVYNGRVYATSGTMTSGGGLDVFNAETLEKIYSVDMGGISQSTPVVCDAYATEENHHTVYVYVCLNNNTGDLVCIEDFDGNTEAKIAYKYQAPQTQYCTHSVVVDQNGLLYYKNDSRGFWALESQASATAISLAKAETELFIGKHEDLNVVFEPAYATNQKCNWVSSDKTIAYVDASGRVTGLKEGEATITATSLDGGFTATCKVKVNPIAVTGVILDVQDSTLYIDDTLALTATVLPDTATDKSVRWTSTDEAVATVNAQGVVKAVAEGQALIIVTTVDGGFADTCTLTVKKENGNTEPAFTFDDINFWVGEGSNQAALVIDWQDERLDHALVWGYRWNGEATGTDMIIAIAQADPRLTLLTHETQYGNTVAGIGFKRNAPGEMTLTFAPEGEEARVVVPENGIVITDNSDYDSWSASEGALWRSGWNTGYFWAYLVADDAAGELISASTGSSDRKLTNGCMDVWNWDSYPTSTEPRMPYEAVTPISIIPVTGVNLDIADSTLYVGDSLALTATVLPDTATNRACTWKSTDETVATVSAQGMVKALAEGQALIIVTTKDGGFADTCTIRVIKNNGGNDTTANQGARAIAVSVYPNPTASDVNVKLDEAALLEVFASNGRLMFRKEVPAGIQTISLETSGLYFVRVSSGNRSTVMRVIKR